MVAFHKGNVELLAAYSALVVLALPNSEFYLVGEGTQVKPMFITSKHVGDYALLLLYLVVLWRGVQIARDAADTFGRLLAVGITSMIAFHVLVNVGMTMGIMPVTGIPLPLMSYGVSSLTTNIMSIAILLNIERRKQKLVF